MSGRGQLAFLIIFLLTANLEAQTLPGASEGLSLYGLLGTVTVRAKQWQRMVLQPRFLSEKFEAVLDLELFLDESGRFKNRGWDFSSGRKSLESLLRKIHHVRSRKKENEDQGFSLKVGDLEDITLGRGAIMWRYRNTLEAPGVKKTGVDLRVGGLSGGRPASSGSQGPLANAVD